MPTPSTSCKTPITSSRRKSVFLRDWWLIGVEGGSNLGVGGFVNRETLRTRGMRLLGSVSTEKMHSGNALETGVQVFGSAAIAKRHDNNTLEAVDGIIITISGSINRSRTQHNGFSPEICNHFVSGFPWNWKEFAAKPSLGKCPETTTRSFPVSFHDLPVTRVRDLLMSAAGESETHAITSVIFRDILEQCATNTRPMNTDIEQEQDGGCLSHPRQTTTSKPQKLQTFSDDSSEETEAKHEQGRGFLSDSTQKTSKEPRTETPRGPVTNDPTGAGLGGTLHTSPVKHCDPFSTLPAAPRREQGRREARKKHDTTVEPKETRKVTKSRQESSLRRSARLKKRT